jgi:hypothetical protein
MSAGSDLKKLTGGGGDAWSKDHEAILAHARDLKYDKVPGVSLPPADAPKETWISAMDKFNAWKAGEVKKEASGKAWWQTYGKSEGGGEGGSAAPAPSGPSALESPVPSNPYYPMRVPEYTAPGLVDYSAYMPAGSMFGYEQYQPYTNPNAIPENIFYYQPPKIYGDAEAFGGMGSGGVSRGGFIRPSTAISVGSGGDESTGSKKPSGADLFNPDVMIPTAVGNVPLGEAYAQLDASRPTSDFDKPIAVNPDLRHDYASRAIESYVNQALIDYDPSLERDVRFTQTSGSNYQQDQARARIEAAKQEILKQNPKAVVNSMKPGISYGRQGANDGGNSSPSGLGVEGRDYGVKA